MLLAVIRGDRVQCRDKAPTTELTVRQEHITIAPEVITMVEIISGVVLMAEGIVAVLMAAVGPEAVEAVPVEDVDKDLLLKK